MQTKLSWNFYIARPGFHHEPHLLRLSSAVRTGMGDHTQLQNVFLTNLTSSKATLGRAAITVQ